MLEKNSSGGIMPRRIVAGSDGKTVRVFKKGTREWEYFVNMVEKLGEKQAEQSLDLIELYIKTVTKLERVDEKVDVSLLTNDAKEIKLMVDIREKLSKQLITIGKELGINEKVNMAATKRDVVAALDEKHGGP